jgi:hypothetical protein
MTQQAIEEASEALNKEVDKAAQESGPISGPISGQQKDQQHALHGGHLAAVFVCVRVTRTLRVLLAQLA